MHANAQELVDAAIKLSPTERVKLVDAVLDSILVEPLRVGEAYGNAELADAWRQEVDRRREEARSGKVDLIPKSEAIPGPRDDG